MLALYDELAPEENDDAGRSAFIFANTRKQIDILAPLASAYLQRRHLLPPGADFGTAANPSKENLAHEFADLGRRA